MRKREEGGGGRGRVERRRHDKGVAGLRLAYIWIPSRWIPPPTLPTATWKQISTPLLATAAAFAPATLYPFSRKREIRRRRGKRCSRRRRRRRRRGANKHFRLCRYFGGRRDAPRVALKVIEIRSAKRHFGLIVSRLISRRDFECFCLLCKFRSWMKYRFFRDRC